VLIQLRIAAHKAVPIIIGLIYHHYSSTTKSIKTAVWQQWQQSENQQTAI